MATIDSNLPLTANTTCTVNSLIRHIMRLGPEQSPARLTFYHFLKYFCDVNEELTPRLLNRFFRRCLLFPEWQENKALLFQETELTCRGFTESFHLPLDMTEVLRADQVQVVVLENMHLLQRFLERWLGSQLSGQHQYRLVPISKQRLAAVILSPDRSLKVIVQPMALGLVEGDLEPLFDEWTLSYKPDLLFDDRPGVVHEIETSPGVTARFTYQRTVGLVGHTVQGHQFQRQTVFSGGELLKFPQLFYPVKRLEQIFVDRKSDPIYIELVNVLEKAVELIDHGHPEAIGFSSAAYKRGKLAFDMIYTDDKLLRALLSNLERTLVQA